ncbi:MAG TPA: phytanoyl-CoA dioxygenase family protein [Pseudonocardiaceae bacterium]|jgi:ectoine hydroxylase-related dioxygenase (phytanoyl-CoA dioxygenase family)|nr:phytanoyl-CoA dioxygenase family protein [Pseudonocardiaceae bacterium]
MTAAPPVPRDGIRERLATDGYLVLPGLVDPAELTALRRRLLSTLAHWDWLDATTEMELARPSRPRQEGGANWWRPYTELQSIEAFHRLAHHRNLLAVLRALVGADAFAHPRRIVSLVFPGFVVPPHQDFSYVQGSVDTCTVWLPLDPQPMATAPVRVLPAAGPRRLRPLHLMPNRGVATDLADDDPRWLTVPLSLGDAVVYHSLTDHMVGPNPSAGIGLACEFRYQSAREPVCRGSLRPHHYPRLPDWPVLTKGWSSRRWVRAPRRLHRVDFTMPQSFATWHRELAVPQSRLVPVAPVDG